jgi:hypothetical protein
MPSRRGFRWDQGNSRLEVQVDGTVSARFDDTGDYFTVPAGSVTVTAGDLKVTAQNLYLGAETAFASTEPTSTAIFKTGTAPAGAIVTSSAVFANDTVLRKIIADGTVSSVG